MTFCAWIRIRIWIRGAANKKLILFFYFLKVYLHHFLELKIKKKSQSSRNQGFSYYFCLVIEGSGSRRPKNIRIRIRIRIRNNGQKVISMLFWVLLLLYLEGFMYCRYNYDNHSISMQIYYVNYPVY
jgi:hypothetical protein